MPIHTMLKSDTSVQIMLFYLPPFRQIPGVGVVVIGLASELTKDTQLVRWKSFFFLTWTGTRIEIIVRAIFTSTNIEEIFEE